jgi:hypothetical protein
MSTDAQQVPDDAKVRPSFNPLKATPEELEQRIEEMKKQAGQQPTDTEANQETQDTPEDTPTKAPEQDDLASELEKERKRRQDLQSYSDKRYNDLKAQLDQTMQQNMELEKLVRELNKPKPKAPLSEEEFNSLATDFPNVDKIAQQRAMQIYEELSAPLYDELQALKAELGKSKELTAKEQLRKLHPDFEKLEHDPDFIQWYQSQPQGVQRLISNNSSVAEIARCLDYYKLERGIKSDKEKKLDASAAVDTKSPTKAATTTPPKTPMSEIRAKMAELTKRGGKKLEEYVAWYEKAKAEDKIDFNR